MCKCILVCDREDTEQFFVCIVLLRILFPDLFHFILFTLHLFSFLTCKEDTCACSCFSCCGCCSCGCATEVYACGYCSYYCCHTASNRTVECRFVVVELYPCICRYQDVYACGCCSVVCFVISFHRYVLECVGRIHTQFQRTAVCRYFVCIEGLFSSSST